VIVAGSIRAHVKETQHMKLRFGFAFAAASAALASLAMATPACSSSSTAADGGTGSGVGKPPARPSGASAADTSTRTTFALRKLWLGDTTRDGKDDANAWKKFGYNLDDRVTKDTKATDVCKPKGGPVVLDGDEGRDNAFGGALLGVLKQVLTAPSTTATQSLEDGTFTVMLDINGLSGDAKQNATGLKGQLFAGGVFSPETDGGTRPSWSGTDNWPVRPELLNGSTVESGSKIKFDNAYISNGTWVSGDPTSVRLSLAFSGVSIDLDVKNATIVADTSGNKLTNGTVAGLVGLEDLKTSIGKVAGRISEQACPGGSLYDVIIQTLTASTDVRLDGATTGECDAISIGIGFEADKVGTPTKVAPPAVAGDDLCSSPRDAGGGG